MQLFLKLSNTKKIYINFLLQKYKNQKLVALIIFLNLFSIEKKKNSVYT
jgi:hypothetical protein